MSENVRDGTPRHQDGGTVDQKQTISSFNESQNDDCLLKETNMSSTTSHSNNLTPCSWIKLEDFSGQPRRL